MTQQNSRLMKILLHSPRAQGTQITCGGELWPPTLHQREVSKVSSKKVMSDELSR